MPLVTERYEAVVSAIDGFEGKDADRGVIEVICPALMGDHETPLPELCEPVHEWGWFYVPDVGEIVEIEVVASSDRDGVFGEASLEALSPKWRSKRFHSDIELEEDADGSVPRPIHDDFTATNYGKRRGFSTPWGHVFLFDDTEGDPRIYLTHMVEQLPVGEAPKPDKMTRIEIEPDGSLKAAFLNKHRIYLTTETGNLLIALDGKPGSEKHKIEFDAATPKLDVQLAEGAHNMTLDPAQFTANLGNGATVKFELKDGGAKCTVGDGAKHVAIVEHLQTQYETLKGKLDAADVHGHPGGGTLLDSLGLPCTGVTGPPTVPVSAPTWDGAINSTKISIPDG